MCSQPKGPMGKSKALETALNNKLLGSHEHLKKGLFSPTPPAYLHQVYEEIDLAAVVRQAIVVSPSISESKYR